MKLQIKQGIKNIGRCVWNIYWRRQMRKFYRHHVSAIWEIVVPGVREAVELALAAHRTLPRIYTIGWDVAVTEDGPIIIEGNADYGPVTY